MLSISAVIPCYNGEDYLAEALQSVAAQTRPAYEVIVVDDGSTDASVEIALAAGARVIRQTNKGEGAARNAGWRAARGDAVASLDADDRWRPNHLATVGALLDDHPTAAAAFGAVQRFGSRNEVITGCVPPGPPAMVLERAFENWLHTTIGSVVRRSALASIGGFDESERYAVDFDLWLRLAKHHAFVATHDITSEWRMHPAQQSATPWRQTSAVYRFRRRFVDSLHLEQDPRAKRYELLFTRVWARAIRDTVMARDVRGLPAEVGAVGMVRPWAGWRGSVRSRPTTAHRGL